MNPATERKMNALMNMPVYNIVKGDEPGTATMGLGKSYTLLINAALPPEMWKIGFDDGIQKLVLDLDGNVPQIFKGAALELINDYKRELLDIAMDEGPVDKEPEQKASPTKKTFPPKKRAATNHHTNVPAPVSMRSKQIGDLTLEDIKQYICPVATDAEAFMFLRLCQARNLNPFTNEAYLIKYDRNSKAQMVVGKEAFTRRAEMNGNIDGYEAGAIVRNENGEIERRQGTFKLPGEVVLGGWAKVYRKDRKYPFISEVAFDEYVGRKKDGTVTSMWATKPATMIRKVALVQALREALPSEFSGMYDTAEMGIDADNVQDAQFEEVNRDV